MENTGIFIPTVLIEFKDKNMVANRKTFTYGSDANNFFADKKKQFSVTEKPIVDTFAYYENSTVIMKQEDIFVPDSLIAHILGYASQKDLLPF